MANAHFTKQYNKIVIAGDTLIDLSADTVTAASMRSGVTAHDANGASVTGTIANVTPAFDGGGLTGGNATLSTSNTSGIFVRRAAVLYNGAANGYIDVADNTSASAQVTRYVTGVTLPKDKTFSITTTADTALDTTSDLTVTNNAYRRVVITNAGTEVNTNTGAVTVTNNSAGTVGISHNSTGNVSCMIHSGGSGDILIGTDSTSDGDIFVQAFAADTGAATSGYQQIVTSGRWYTRELTPSTSAQGPYYGKVSVNAMTQMTLPSAASAGYSGTFVFDVTPDTHDKYINLATGWLDARHYFTIKGDANLTAENIADGVSIFGVTGTHSGGGPTVTLNSGGVTWETCCTFPSSGVGWREEKFSDGRLVRYVWDWFTMSSAGRSSAIATSGATAFVGTPIFTPSFRANGNYACKGSVTAWSNTSCTIYLYENSYGGRVAVCIKMEGFWQ